MSPPAPTPLARGHFEAAPGWALDLVEEARVARLATTDGEGQPSVVAICFARLADRLYTPIDGKPKRTKRLRRLRDLAANPRVAVVVDRWDEDWSRLAWVAARGTGTVLAVGEGEPGERAVAIGALRDRYRQYRDGSGESALLPEDSSLVRIEVEELRWWRASEESGA